MLTDETISRVRDAWGSPPVNAYAATEAPGIATDSLERVGMHVWEESVVVEVVDDRNRPVPPGVPGSKVLLTNLVNHALPLIRYELSDSVVLAEGPDPSGHPFTRIARVDGRSDDILSFPGRDGLAVRVHPHRLRSPFSTLLEVRQYQIVHRRDGALRVDIVAGSAARASSWSGCAERWSRRSRRQVPSRRPCTSSRSTASSAMRDMRRSSSS